MRTENQTEESMSQRLGETYQSVLNVLKCALWNTGKASVDPEVFRELKHHAVSTLPAGVLSSLTMPEKMRAVWQREIYQQISYNVNYRHEQAALPVSVPYVILKGTSAAKYYPHPEYRSIGDIDIMPQRKDFAAACEELLQNGAEAIVLGCTELSLVKRDEMIGCGFLDAMEVLAQRTVLMCGCKVKEEYQKLIS